jgi:2-succinyl-5-enolpyruvyl-6-hydroxy-3-cyclohexene-1-carboxylate synthase
MYSDNKTVQIVISLLKEFGVRHLVLSAGTRNVPFVHSVEKDPYFTCYSIVDERSAAYFALGLALEVGEPVLMSCTSGTATTNYTSAMWEAFRQKLPLIALTSDRNQYYLDQMEDQMITQSGMYRSACRKSVTLPIVEDEKDAWYCRRLVNEALLELDHHGGGPVHINLPTEWGLFAQNFNTKELPRITPIRRYSLQDPAGMNEKVAELKQKRVLVIYGQSRPASDALKASIEGFVSKYNCAIAVESISNLECKGTINTNLTARSRNKETILEYVPDVVISVQGDYVSTLKGLLKGPAVFEHWAVNEEGKVVDQFKKQTAVFECSPDEFFAYFNEHGGEPVADHSYLEFWQDRIENLPAPDFPYSSAYAMQEFLKQVPPNSRLHHGNGVAVHMAQYFPADSSIITYCHTATTTIDGSLSAFIGQSAATNDLCFAFIGDLSFFYDMNAIWNRHVGSNVRILLYNNEGGQTFHWNAAKEIDTLHLHTSAEHFSNAKGWVESQGFKYLCARTKEEFDALLPEFVAAESDMPICFEVFTDKRSDAQTLHDYYGQCRSKLDSLANEAEDADQ